MGSGSIIRYEYKDDFEWIRVIDHFPRAHRYLHFEDSIQGAVDLADHRVPVFEYIGLMADCAALYANLPNRILLGGLGSCGLLHAVTNAWPKAHTITVESSSRIYELAKQFFRLDPRAKVLIGDLRSRLAEQRKLTDFDLVLVDCYNATSIPPHLTAVEFFQEVAQKMTPGALLVCNFWDSKCNELCGDMVRTVLDVFEEVALIDCVEDQNLVLCATKPPLTRTWPAVHRFKGNPYPMQVLKLHEPDQWPGFMYEAKVMRDNNLNEFFQAIGLVF